MKILTQAGQGFQGYHGKVGTPTNMFDSFGEPLFVGDVVKISNQSDIGEEYGTHYVCEEDTSIASWTGKNHQYVMSIGGTWNNEFFADHPIDYESDYWDNLLELSDGWIVHKVKDHSQVTIGERWDHLYVDDVDENR